MINVFQTIIQVWATVLLFEVPKRAMLHFINENSTEGATRK